MKITFLLRIAYTMTIATVATVVATALILAILPLDYLYNRLRSRHGIGPGVVAIKTIWARALMFTHGVTIELQGPGAKDLTKFEGVIFVANHQSVADILVSLSEFPSQFWFIAKYELRKIPVFGWGASKTGTLFINRAKGANNESLKEVKTILAQKGSIVFYPEGTRSSHGHLLPFKRGAFVMAIEARAPIVPITILNSYEICPKGRLYLSPGRIIVYVDEAIPTHGCAETDRYDLAERVHRLMAKHLEKFHESRKDKGSAEVIGQAN